MRADRRASEGLDRHRQEVDAHGWSVVEVSGGGRRALPFAHTVGLDRAGHPELLVSGRGWAEAEVLLGSLADEVLAGRRFHVGDVLRAAPWPPLLLLRVTAPGALVAAQAMLGSDEPVPALQAVWADDADRWPWDPAWVSSPRQQQLFGNAPKIAQPRTFA